MRTSLRATRLVALSAVVLVVTGCALDVGVDTFGATRAPIVGGAPEPGYPSVVYLYHVSSRGESACTATIIAPRVVLTAKHCVREGMTNAASRASQFQIYVGSSDRAFTAMYDVAEVRAAPGSWDIEDGSDIAVLILSTPASEPPIPYSRERPSRLGGMGITAIGYGQLPDGSSGTKYRVATYVEYVMGNFVIVDPSVCSGDSGGPLLDSEGAIRGVASYIFSPDRRSSPQCGTAPGAYSSIYPYLDFIDQAVTDSGSCVMTGAEICDGTDNDCNGGVDEGCTPLGGACTASETCVGGLCETTPAGQICTRVCDPAIPNLGCPPGLYCSGGAGCDGRCIPGLPGTTAYDAPCTADTDCGTLLCTDPGDGRRRCLAPCRADAGECVTGEACAAAPGDCGACVPEEILASTRGIGEPCAADDACLSGRCLTDTGLSYCTRTCSEDATCGLGYRCLADHLCHRGLAEPTGGPCHTDEHCMAPGACATRSSESWCTVTCTNDMACPTGFGCEPVSDTVSVCAPDLALLGAPCTTNEECTTGLCELGSGVCTRFCDADSPCGAGDSCRRIEDGTRGVCIGPPPPAPPEPSGCGCRLVSGRADGGSVFAGGLACVLLLARARRRNPRRRQTIWT